MANETTTENINLDYVFPKLEYPWIKLMVENYNEMHDIELPSCPKITSIKELDVKIRKILYDVFVSRSLTSQFALKYRFLNYMKYSNAWNKFEIMDAEGSFGEIHPDLILSDSNEKTRIWIFFNEIFDEKVLRTFRTTCNNVRGGAKAENIASKIVFISGKSHREINLEDPITIRIAGNQTQSWRVSFEIWIEEKNAADRPFNDEDLIVIRDQEFAGFNFSSIDDLLDIIKTMFGNGQFEIQRIPNYFSTKNANRSSEKETIWKGIIFPKKIFK